MPDLFDRLADRDVPPPPQGLRRGIHVRLNRWLVVLQTAEFVCCAVPYSVGAFAKSLLGWIVLTLSGRHVVERPQPRRSDD